MTPAGFESLEICHYPTFLTDYQSTRRSLSTTTDHCNSREAALHLLRQILEDLIMKDVVPGSSTHKRIVNGTTETMKIIEIKFVSLYVRMMTNIIHCRLTAECIDSPM
jgi:hypothetical protein